MPFCTKTCNAVSEAGSSEPRNGDIVAGDILAVRASVSHPICAVIKGDKIGNYSVISGNQMDRLTFASQKSTNYFKTRPALLMPFQGGTKLICLMGTFEGNDVSKFPRIVRHYLMPIYPTPSTSTSAEHLHTTPDWRGNSNPQWILAYPFELPHARLDRRWSDNGGLSQSHYCVDDDGMIGFGLACRAKVLAWHKHKTEFKRMAASEYQSWQKALRASLEDNDDTNLRSSLNETASIMSVLSNTTVNTQRTATPPPDNALGQRSRPMALNLQSGARLLDGLSKNSRGVPASVATGGSRRFQAASINSGRNSTTFSPCRMYGLGAREPQETSTADESPNWRARGDLVASPIRTPTISPEVAPPARSLATSLRTEEATVKQKEAEWPTIISSIDIDVQESKSHPSSRCPSRPLLSLSSSSAFSSPPGSPNRLSDSNQPLPRPHSRELPSMSHSPLSSSTSSLPQTPSSSTQQLDDYLLHSQRNSVSLSPMPKGHRPVEHDRTIDKLENELWGSDNNVLHVSSPSDLVQPPKTKLFSTEPRSPSEIQQPSKGSAASSQSSHPIADAMINDSVPDTHSEGSKVVQEDCQTRPASTNVKKISWEGKIAGAARGAAMGITSALSRKGKRQAKKHTKVQA